MHSVYPWTVVVLVQIELYYFATLFLLLFLFQLRSYLQLNFSGFYVQLKNKRILKLVLFIFFSIIYNKLQ